MKVPIWIVPISLGAWLYSSGEDPGMVAPFVVGPVLVAFVEGWWSARAAETEAQASVRAAELEAIAEVRKAETEAEASRDAARIEGRYMVAAVQIQRGELDADDDPDEDDEDA